MTDDLNLLSIKGAAEIADCDRTTILRAIKKGDLKAKLVETPFNHEWWGIAIPDLEKWMIERKRGNMQQKIYGKNVQVDADSVWVGLRVSPDNHKVTNAYTDNFNFKAQDAIAMFGGKTEEEIMNDGFVLWAVL